jgi:hypothetical protein
MPEGIDLTPQEPADVTPTEPATDVTVDSSPEQGGPSVLDSVKSALEAQKTGSGASPDPQRQDPAAQVDPAKAVDAVGNADLSPDELKRLNRKTQERIRFLIGESKTANERATTFAQQAKAFGEVQNFFREGGYTPEQVVQAIEFVKNLKVNPDAAWDYVVARAKELAEFKGLLLSPQLEDRVQRGFLTREDAQQLAAAQASARRATETTAEQRQRAEQLRQEHMQGQLVTMGTQTATAWESERARTDPDWALKQPHVFMRVENALLKNGTPRSPQDVRQMLDTIYKQVSDELSKLRPAPRAMTGLRGVASQRDGVAEPKTALEAARLALAR